MEMVSPSPESGDVEKLSEADTIKTTNQLDSMAPNNKPETRPERKTALSRIRLSPQNSEKLLRGSPCLWLSIL